MSTRTTGRPSTSSSVSIASRVVPARSETITRSEPRKALTSEDLPALGRPITATRAALVLLGGRGALAEQLDDAVEQVAAAEAVGGRDRLRLAEAELVELGGQVLVLGPVDLVGGDQDRDLGAAQGLRQLGVAGADAGAGVDDEQHDVGLGDPDPRLALDVAGQLVLVGEVDAAGVEQLEGDAVPLAAHPLAVAGDAGLGVGDRLPPAGEPVDQGALADVGEADDGDGRAAGSCEAPLAGEGDDAGDDLLPREAGGVDLDRVVGGSQGAVLAVLGRGASRSRCAASTAASSSPVCGGAAAGALLAPRP